MAKSKSGPRNTRANGPPPATAEVLSLLDAAAYLRVPAEDVVRMVRTQGLPGRQIGEEWRFLKAGIQLWLGTSPMRKGLLGHIGAAKDDPYRDEMLAEIYNRRGRPEAVRG
jgi:excisionase family DNA binding protein